MSRSHLYELVREGLPQESPGRFDPVRCMYWYLGKLGRAVRRTNRGVEDERKRLIRAQADSLEAELNERRADLVPIAYVHQRLTPLLDRVKARARAIPGRVAHKIIGETERLVVQGTIAKEIRAALTEMATYGPSPATTCASGKARRRK